MGQAKTIVLRPITRSEAEAVIKREHYSGSVTRNSQLHIGVFYGGRLEGAMQFGPSLDKRKIIGLVSGTKWDGFLELNRLAFSDAMPRNSESRALAIAMRILRKNRPDIEWIISFADATQCGDGAIYRASGFVLTGIKKSTNLARLKNGDIIHKMTVETSPTLRRDQLDGKSYYDVTGGRLSWRRFVELVGAEILEGYQLRYIYFLNEQAKKRLTVEPIPFARIREIGATMYKGKGAQEAQRLCGC